MWRHRAQHQDKQFVVTRHMPKRPGVTPPPPLPQNQVKVTKGYTGVVPDCDGVTQNVNKSVELAKTTLLTDYLLILN